MQKEEITFEDVLNTLTGFGRDLCKLSNRVYYLEQVHAPRQRDLIRLNEHVKEFYNIRDKRQDRMNAIENQIRDIWVRIERNEQKKKPITKKKVAKKQGKAKKARKVTKPKAKK